MRTAKLLTIGVVLLWTSATASRAWAAGQVCEGDCNGDGVVAINELILGLRIVLEDRPIDQCRAIDGDGNGSVSLEELVSAVNRASQGCGGPVDEAALAASTRVATESILRFFDLQSSVSTAASLIGRSPTMPGRPTGTPGCQQFDCIAFGRVFGTQEDCCSGTVFSRFFDSCSFVDDLGRIVTLNGLYVLQSDAGDVCSGAIPVGSSFAAELSSFTQHVSFPDGSFSRTSHELTETFEAVPGGCSASQPDPLGFGIRGNGRRFMHGVMRRFQGDGAGHILVDNTSQVRALEVAVNSTPAPGGCTVGAVLNGSLIGTDFRRGSRFRTAFSAFHVNQRPDVGSIALGLEGALATNCIGEVRLSTPQPLRVSSNGSCFTAGRLEAQVADDRVSATYAANGLDLDFGADGHADQHFAACTDVPIDQCDTSRVGLCGTCTDFEQCEPGLVCFSCTDNCSGNTRRCSLADRFVTCEDGAF